MSSKRKLDIRVENALKKIRELLLLNYSTGLSLPEVQKALKNGDVFWFKDNPRALKTFESKVSKTVSSIDALIISLVKEGHKNGKSASISSIPSIRVKSKTGQKELESLQRQAKDSFRGSTAASFVNQKRSGFTISERVWGIGDSTKNEMEVIIQNAIKEGLSAEEVSKQLRPYLNEPKKLFRRVRNKETGELEWSEAAKKYKPGRGVYRSAYKNAKRLARTEINIAYNTALWEQFKDDPSVVGFEVKLSNNHTLNGEPFHDICDELAGKYPKSFKFTGWHPQCRCNFIPIYISDDDFLNRIRARKEGKLDQWKPKGIEDVPAKFKDWLGKNKDRFQAGAKLPLFLTDNQKMLSQIIGKNIPIAIQEPTIAPPSVSKPDEQKLTIDFTVKTNSDLDKVIKQLDTITGGEIFKTGFKTIQAERRASNNGSTDRNGNIWLKKDRMEMVKDALNYIRQGKATTYEQEDALSTLWHEMTHNRNPIQVILDGGRRDGPQRRSMELANEFVSRKTLPEFMKLLGGELRNRDLIGNRSSTGYNIWVKNYDLLIKKVGADPSMVLKDVSTHLFKMSYSSQKDGLVNAILNNAKLKINKNDVNALVNECIAARTEAGYEFFLNQRIK